MATQTPCKQHRSCFCQHFRQKRAYFSPVLHGNITRIRGGFVNLYTTGYSQENRLKNPFGRKSPVGKPKFSTLSTGFSTGAACRRSSRNLCKLVYISQFARFRRIPHFFAVQHVDIWKNLSRKIGLDSPFLPLLKNF